MTFTIVKERKALMDRIPLTDKKDYELEIQNQDSQITVRELSVIGNGGSCIVYKAYCDRDSFSI